MEKMNSQDVKLEVVQAEASGGEGAKEEEEEEERRKRSSLVFERYVQPGLAELLGTTLFVFVGCSSVIGNTGGVLQPAVAHGLALAVVIQMFGNISGGHCNPVVSLTVYLCGGLQLLLLLLFVVAQLVGATIGAALAKAVYPAGPYAAALGGAVSAVESSGEVGGAIIAEATVTLFLTIVVCLVGLNQHTRSPTAPFCVGLTVTACILAGASVSGACMNPARAFGPAVAANHWSYHWIYWVGPLCGALLAVCFTRLMFGDRRTRLILK